ncbi:MAG: hypothetical protein WCD57_03535 [Acidobacteriaceae bacterium]
MEPAEVIVAGGEYCGPPTLRTGQTRELSIRLYPEYLSTVEGLSGRSVRLRIQAAISTDEEDGTSVAMSAQEAQRRAPGLAARGLERRTSALLGGDGTLS